MKKLSLFFLLFVTLGAVAQKQLELDSIMRQFHKANVFNGTVLVAKEGKVVFNEGYGFADAVSKKTNDANTIFQIGSVTKQFTVAAIMKLQEERKLSVSDYIGKYFPELEGGDSITIHHLLTHRSGLYNYTDDTAMWYGRLSKEKLIDYTNKRSVLFKPGAKMQYNNTGYALLGYLIEKLSGKKYEQYIRDNFFKPLKMTSSGFDFANLSSPHKPKGYYDNGTTHMQARVIDSTVSYSAGAIYSTTGDMLKWSGAILNQKLIKPASWKLMTTNHSEKYGYGLVIDSVAGEKNIWHNGGLDGFVSTFYNLPNQKITIVVFANYMQSNTIRVANTLAAAMLNKPYDLPKGRTEISLPAETLKQYVGKYQLAPTFAITITLEDAKMMAQATGQPKFQVYPEKENFFFYKVVDAQLEFVKDDKGFVTELILHQNGMKQKAKKLNQ
jgi:CubicO group peptidase (beta-lactamase class C family)